MGKTRSKYLGLIACIVAIIVSIILSVAIIVKADNTENDTVNISYEDDYYCDSIVLDVDNEIVKDIYDTYENGNLELLATDNDISYQVDENDVKKVDALSSALCMEMDRELQLDKSALLYLGEKQDCEFDKETGLVKSQFDNKWILVNNEVPIAMYNEKIDESTGLKQYYTSAFINEDEVASNILITLDKSNVVSIVGKVIDKDVDGNPLEEVQIEDLKSGDILCPAYVNYNYSVVNIANSVLEATEVYNQDTYTYGMDYVLSYESLPDNFYLYSMRTNYIDDTQTVESEAEYGYFTEPKEISIVNDKIVEINDIKASNIGLDGYDYMGCFDFLKQVWAHKKATTKEEIYQTFEHHIDGVEKGYISTWNSLVINKALRTDTYDSLDDEDKLTTETLNNMCKRIGSKKNYLMLRKVSADYLTNVFGIKGLDGEMLSDEKVKDYSEEEKTELENRLQSIVGNKMVEKGFMSASILPYANIIFGRTVEIVIKVPAGAKYYVSHNVIESEAIFPTNTELTVESVKYDKDKEKYIIIANLTQNI